MASGSMVWFSCCVTRAAPTKRPRIDRTMIGSPTNFRHTAHVGSNDVSENTNCLSSIQMQMSTKGGYDHASPVDVRLKVTDVQSS